MRIAIDVNYPDLLMGKLVRKGFLVMVVAEKGEADEDWLARGMPFDIEAVVSRDLDVPNWLDRNGFHTILCFETIEDLIRYRDRVDRIARSKGE